MKRGKPRPKPVKRTHEDRARRVTVRYEKRSCAIRQQLHDMKEES